MGDGQPAKELRHLLVLTLLGPKHEVPMVAHQRVAHDPQRDALDGLGDQGIERGEVGRLLKQAEPPIGPVEHMVRVTRPQSTEHDAACGPAYRLNLTPSRN
jgi:hypothetical protein